MKGLGAPPSNSPPLDWPQDPSCFCLEHPLPHNLIILSLELTFPLPLLATNLSPVSGQACAGSYSTLISVLTVTLKRGCHGHFRLGNSSSVHWASWSPQLGQSQACAGHCLCLLRHQSPCLQPQGPMCREVRCGRRI